jgi:hypothetical protein
MSAARWGLVAVAALALTLAVTWPLARCFGSCLDEPPDPLLSVYFLGWVTHALLTPGVRLLDASFFAPYSGTLALGEYLPVFIPVSVPIVAVTGNPVAAHNTILVLSHVLAALGAVALAVRLTGALAPALVAGVVFGFAPRLLDQAYNIQTLTVFWFPWLLLALERFLERPTWLRATQAAAAWLALSLSSSTVFAYATVVAGLFLAAAVTVGRRSFGRAHLVPLAGVGVVALALVIWVVFAPTRALGSEWGMGRALAEVERHSAALRDVVGVPREALLRHVLGLSPEPYRVEWRSGVPGVVAAALAIVGLVAVARGARGLRIALLPYLAVLGGAGILALGPTLATPWGALPLPYHLLYLGLPGFSAMRSPFRLLFFVDLVVALLAAVGVAWALRQWRGRARPVAIAALVALILVESVPVPYPGAFPRLDPGTLPAVYRWLDGQAPDTIALGIPIGDWANIAAAAFHHRRVVNGWSSYLPPHYRELVDAMERFPDERSLALARGAGVTLVLVDRTWLTPARLAALSAVPSALRPERAFPTHLVYRLPPEGAAVGRVEVTGQFAPGRGCVRLGNPGPGFVPFYPLHRVHLAPDGAGDGVVRWLPLDLAPGAAYIVCLPLPAGATAPHLRGAVEDGARVYRFDVAPESPPARLEPVAR